MRLTSLFLLGATAILGLLATPSTENRALAVRYAQGVLRIAIPDDTPRLGPGRLAIEVLDPEDGVAAGIEKPVLATPGHGVWRQELTLPKGLPLDDLVWHRLRYRFTYSGQQTAAVEGIASISQLLRLPVVHVFGQQSFLSGSAVAVRLVVTEQDHQTPVRSGAVSIELQGEMQSPRPLFRGKLSERGTAAAHFRLPAGLSGTHSLRYVVDTGIGTAEHTQPIRIEEKSSVLLSTEKPVYQPGQTIHARALALDRANYGASGGRPLTFELEDSRGNKVSRQATRTDDFGIASAAFVLADEVNLGSYRLQAQLDGESAVETPLRVERYVLPRFKVAVELPKAKRGYRPGDTVAGTVRASYFFGKPVAGAAVMVRAEGNAAATAQGRTGRDGAFPFQLRLPEIPDPGVTPVMLEAIVKDATGHSESRAESIAVSVSPLLLTAIPEGGDLVPGLATSLFVIAAYADGTPAQADVRIEIPKAAALTATTDSNGIAAVTLPGSSAATARIEAWDRDGNRASVNVSLPTRDGSHHVLLRSSRAVYRSGEPIRLQVHSTRRHGTAYVDAIRNGQTVGLYEVEIANGAGDLEIGATPDLTGAVAFTAHLAGSQGQPIVDRKLVFVQPPEELRIETELDRAVYKPGSEARIGFQVTNSRGEGVPAALGLEIVDQAVFALAEKQPGFAKVFFHLEQELRTPRFPVPSLSWSQAISSADPADLAARVLFAATEQIATPVQAAATFGGAVPRLQYAAYAARYQSRLRDEIDHAGGIPPRVAGATQPICDRSVLAGRLGAARFSDPWGARPRVEPGAPGTNTFVVRSAGPDGTFQTADDLVQVREDRYCTEPAFTGWSQMELRFENSGRRLGGPAEVSGTVMDPTGAVIARADVSLNQGGSGKTWKTASGEDGRFTLVDLPTGEFEIRVDSPGFRRALRRFSLGGGDHAIFSAVLDVGSVTESVEVTAAAPLLMTETSMASPAPGKTPRKEASTQQTHVRSWFPESLYIAPRILTDGQGRASIRVPIADSITSWRMAMLASTRSGALGAATSSLKVFQDFFAEMDLPVVLTEGDRVSLPVAVYNYSGVAGPVRLRLQQEDWFSVPDNTTATRLPVEKNGVSGAQFPIEAKRIGKFKLTLIAEMEGPVPRKDIVVREVEVVPNGREQSTVSNGRLTGAVEEVVAFPPNAIADAGRIFVRLYPGPMSQVVEGMDAILQMPYGCFEQTSSATYPNILALAYMKRTGKLTPEIRAKAEGFIATGYQRLLTFEVPGGGFSWFGQAPANKILTAYGLMEFAEMSEVYDIDRRVISRTQQWLAGQQQADGSWKPDTAFINEGVTNHYNHDLLRITAYLAWSLESTGYEGPELARARAFIQRKLTARVDAYTLAILANLAVESGDRALVRQVIPPLLRSRVEKGAQAWWPAEETALYGTGTPAAIETTSLALQALLKSGEAPSISGKGLAYIVAGKQASGTWGTTQATVLALKALLLSAEKGSGDARGTVEITLNGEPARTVVLTPDNADLFHQFALTPADSRGPNTVGLRFHGEGGLAYQVAGRYFLPWTAAPAGNTLAVDVDYDRTVVAEGDIVTAKARVRSQMPGAARMVMLELGIPPGFALLDEDLEAYRQRTAARRSGRLEKFTVNARQAILYFDSIAPGATVTVRYRLRAKYPIRAAGFSSRVYQYYDPAVGSTARPVRMEVRPPGSRPAVGASHGGGRKNRRRNPDPTIY